MAVQIKVKTDVSTEPVTTAEAKNYLKLPSGTTADDTLIGELITAARELCEQYTGRAFAEKTIQVFIDSEEGSEFDLPLPPQEDGIDTAFTMTVKRVYSDGTSPDTLTVNNDYYIKGMTHKTVEIAQYWTSRADTSIGYRFEYTTGYNSNNSLPKVLKEAVLKTVATNYYNREDIADTGVRLPNEAKMLMTPYKLTSWFTT